MALTTSLAASKAAFHSQLSSGSSRGHGAVCTCSQCVRRVSVTAMKRGLCAQKTAGWAASDLMGQAFVSRKVVRKIQRKAGITAMSTTPSGIPPKSNIWATLLDVTEADRQKVEGMPYRRTVFTFNDWEKHRSSGRYIRHIQSMWGSRVISSLGPAVFAMTTISAFVVAYNTLYVQHQLPEWAPLLHINPLPFSLTSSALSFLLVFRTNASYGRFDEARKMWGLMLNRTRDICRQALSYMARDEFEYERPRLMQFLRHIQAFPLAYKHHMVQEGDLEYDLKTYTSLTEDEIKGILEATHRPNYVLQMASECMRSCHVDPVPRLSMDQNLTTFADDIGGSERIFKTPIPLSYTRLTSRFMVLWHAFLPFGLWDACGIMTVPVTAFISAVLFCVEEVGVLIEEPFSILALAVISQSARNNVSELLNLHEGIKARIVPNEGEPTNGAPPSLPPPGPTATIPASGYTNGGAAAPAPTPEAVQALASSLVPSENGTMIQTDAPTWSRR